MSPNVVKLSLSCVECRSRKVKCDRADPCGNCVERSVPCSKEVLRKPNRKKRASVGGARGTKSRSLSWQIPAVATVATALPSEAELRPDSTATSQRSGNEEAIRLPQPLMLSSPSFAVSASTSHVTPASLYSEGSQAASYDGLNDVLFSDAFLDSLIGASEKHTPVSSGNSNSAGSDNTTQAASSTAASSYSPSSATHEAAPTMPLRNALCVLGFRLDASLLSEQTIAEYRQCLPTPCSVERVVTALDRRTTLLSLSRHDWNAFLDVDAFTNMLRSHSILFMQSDAPLWSTLTASDIFFVVCGLYLAAKIEKQDTKAVSALAQKLSRQLAGCETTLQLLQSYRMLAAACSSDNEMDLAALAISSGSRAAVSMGIHKASSVSERSAREQAYLTEAVLGLLCDACVMQAVFGMRTSIDPANVEASLADLGEPSLQDSVASPSSHRQIAPVRLRLHATVWIFIERYYGSSVHVRLPTEERLQTIAPLLAAEPFELAQCSSLSTILRHSSLLIERPLTPWLSPLRRNNVPPADSDSVGLSKAIQMLFMIRYYHILVVYPFVRLHADARSTLEETVRSIISSTWRMAKRSDTDCSMSSLDFCRRICLRALAFLVATTNYHSSSCAEAEAQTPGIDHKERIVADLELGVDAIEKIDHILADKQPLASLASQLSVCGMGLEGARQSIS